MAIPQSPFPRNGLSLAARALRPPKSRYHPPPLLRSVRTILDRMQYPRTLRNSPPEKRSYQTWR